MSDPVVPAGNGLLARAQAILLKPAATWPAIAAEPATPGELITRYAVPLAAIGPVAGFIGGQLFGYGGFGITFKPTLVGGLTSAIVQFVMALVGVVVLALIADWLAPKFGGQSNRVNAFKLVVYSMTAAWLAGIFGLVPALMILALLGLYSFYLLYTGAAPLMKVPPDKAAGYTGVTVVAAVVLYLVVGAVAAAVTRPFVPGPSLASAGTVTIPGVGTVDTAKMEAATQQLEAASKGEVKPIPAIELQKLLPAALGAYQRTAVESTGAGAMGSQAEGTYTAADKTIRLRVVDMSALGALSGLGAAMGVEQNREDANGYERTGTVDGQMQTEQWNRTDGRGKFGRVVANRFMIEAEGQAGSVDELKAAVASVDQGRLTGMAQ